MTSIPTTAARSSFAYWLIGFRSPSGQSDVKLVAKVLLVAFASAELSGFRKSAMSCHFQSG